jgi:hypothetical protein
MRLDQEVRFARLLHQTPRSEPTDLQQAAGIDPAPEVETSGVVSRMSDAYNRWRAKHFPGHRS